MLPFASLGHNEIELTGCFHCWQQEQNLACLRGASIRLGTFNRDYMVYTCTDRSELIIHNGVIKWSVFAKSSLQTSDHFMNAPSQWAMTLHCNVIPHWPGAYTKWSLQKSYSCVDIICLCQFKVWPTVYLSHHIAELHIEAGTKCQSFFWHFLMHFHEWKYLFEFRVQFDWNLFLRFQLTKIQHWLR